MRRHAGRQALTQERTHARTHSLARTHARTHTHTHACTHARTHAHTHTHTYTHTRTVVPASASAGVPPAQSFAHSSVGHVRFRQLNNLDCRIDRCFRRQLEQTDVVLLRVAVVARVQNHLIDTDRLLLAAAVRDVVDAGGHVEVVRLPRVSAIRDNKVPLPVTIQRTLLYTIMSRSSAHVVYHYI